MAKFTIYSKDGKSARCIGEPQFSGSYMGVDYIEFRTISSPVPVTWAIGDYVDYYRTGLRYKLYSLPMPNKVARRGAYGASFEYSNVQLYAATKELEIAPFRDLVADDNKIHFTTRQDFSTHENVYGIARRIQACMDDIFPGKWRIEVIETEDETLLATLDQTKEFSVSGISCLDALGQIYDTWKNIGWTHTYDTKEYVDVITIGGANTRTTSNTTDSYEYGIGKGLTSIRKASANPDEFATRLYIYGSERNIQTRYYNQFDILNKESVDIRNLMLPLDVWGKTDGLPDARKAYLQASDDIIEKFGLIPRTVYFDGSQNEEIYPSINGLTMKQIRDIMVANGQGGSDYLPADLDKRLDLVEATFSSSDYGTGDKEETEKKPTFRLGLRPFGFNLIEQGRLTDEGYAKISMLSGKCAGREFVVKKETGARAYVDGELVSVFYELEKEWDESLGMAFPNETYPIKADDRFVLLDIPMPEYYITLAQNKLLEQGRKLLADYTRVSAFYEPNIDPIVIKSKGKALRAGMYMSVHDNDIIETAGNTDYVLIDTLTIDESSPLPIYKVTLREQKRAYRNFGVLEDMIEDAKLESKKEVISVKQYTDRRFRSAQETMAMLQSAFKNFSEGISPVTVQTMAMLIGDKSLQFKFIASSGTDMSLIDPVFSYNSELKRFESSTSVRLLHMTLGIEDVAPMSSRAIDGYLKWLMPAQSTEAIEQSDKGYYIYARVPKDGASGKFVPSIDPIEMEQESGCYHFLVGILNAEYEGTREFVPLYGFTEILPGQITTDAVRSADGKTYFDLAGNMITVGQKTGLSGTDEQLRMWAGASNAHRNDAPFRVYDNGQLVAQDAIITGNVNANGGKIGSLYITEDGLSVAEIPKDMEFGDVFGAIMITDKTVSFGAMQATSSSQATSIRNVFMNIGNSSSDTPALQANSNRIAIRCSTGTFEGLRTSTKVLSSGGTATDPNTLTVHDYNVLIPDTSSATYYIELPSSPKDGQEYWIETFGADVFALSHNKLWSHDLGEYKDSSVSGYISTHKFQAAGVIRFKYYSGANCWTYTWVEER